MYFQESEAIAREHPDLICVVEQVDSQLSGIASPAPLRPADFSSALRVNANQVTSVFELLAQKGVLLAEDMVECDGCNNLMSRDAFRQAIEDEDEFECSSCSRLFRRDSEPIVVYRMTMPSLSRPKPDVPKLEIQTASGEEPLGKRAQCVLIAMHDLGAIDSDTRLSTERIAARALGNEGDPNSLKNVVSDLCTRQLINTKTGRTGGCWLTGTGRLRAQKLAQSSQNSATV
jgi:hypothetical protein